MKLCSAEQSYTWNIMRGLWKVGCQLFACCIISGASWGLLQSTVQFSTGLAQPVFKAPDDCQSKKAMTSSEGCSGHV